MPGEERGMGTERAGRRRHEGEGEGKNEGWGVGEKEKGGKGPRRSTVFRLNSNHLGMVNSWVPPRPQALKEWELVSAALCCI